MGKYEDLVERHGGVKAAARAIGIPASTFSGWLKRERQSGQGSSPPRKRSARGVSGNVRVPALSEKELLSTYDPYERARAQMERIPALIQPGQYIKDFEMRKAVGLAGDPRLFRELAEDPEMDLAQFQFLIGKGTKEALCWTDPETKERILEDYPLTTRDVVAEAREG